ncbi:MAG: SMP-30/gluconolactonase/LRE family protein [Burkholderiaceae bacterium]
MHKIDPLAAARVDTVEFIGAGLQRPECVLCTRAGHWYSADWRGGVAHGRPDGSQAFYGAPVRDGRPMRPNGIALLPGGDFLLADLGESLGGIFRLSRAGQLTAVAERIDGVDLPPTNFVTTDRAGRIWFTVSTRKVPRALGYRPDCDDGFIAVHDAAGTRIVADGLGYTNECVFDRAERWLYVNETFGRRLSRFPVREDGTLGARETVSEFGAGMFPDGLAVDASGDLWVTSIVSNRLVHVRADDGAQTVWLEDSDAAHLEEVERAYRGPGMGRPHLDAIRSRRLRNISSLAFGGPTLRTGHLGCLLGDAIACVTMPVAGLEPVHWHADD